MLVPFLIIIGVKICAGAGYWLLLGSYCAYLLIKLCVKLAKAVEARGKQ